MVDRYLEDFRCECGECEACCQNWEFFEREADEYDFDLANDQYLNRILGCANDC